MLRIHSLPILLALGLAACDTQADPDYTGDPLVTIKGTVRVEVAPSPSGTNAAVVWHNTAMSPDRSVAETVPVAGQFPAGFTLDVVVPPVEAALNDLTPLGPGETRIGIALILALPADYDPAGGADPGPGWGVSEHHVLAYVEDDIQPGSNSASLVGGALPAGFHILEVIDVDDPSCPGESFDCLRPAPAGLDTPIEVRIAAPQNLNVPDWT